MIFVNYAPLELSSVLLSMVPKSILLGHFLETSIFLKCFASICSIYFFSNPF